MRTGRVKRALLPLISIPTFSPKLHHHISNYTIKNDIINLMGTEKSCGCIIIDGNKVLLIGSKDDNGEIFYGFPKSHQEQGEMFLRRNNYEVSREKN